MDIIIGRIQLAKEDRSRKKSLKKDAKKDGKKEPFKDRRINNQDRRQGIRDGVIVSLSTKNDRRVLPDRRQKDLGKNTYTI
jgi:hypothetical protein